MNALLAALSERPDMRVHRQNTGQVEVWKHGKPVGIFKAGPPKGAADISGILYPEGLRLEVETKSPTADERPHQEAWGMMIRRFGGVYAHVRADKALSLAENVRCALIQIDEEIARRRAQRPAC